MKAAPEPSLYNIDQFICCVAGSSRANESGISYPYHKMRERTKPQRDILMATQTPITFRAPSEVLINENRSAANPAGKTAFIVLGSVLGLIVLAFLYYQTIGI